MITSATVQFPPNPGSGSALAAGPPGPATTLSIGTVTTGAPGSLATAEIVGSAPSQTLHLVIPRGDTGPAMAGIPAFAGLTSSSVRLSQFLIALEATSGGRIAALEAAIPPEPGDSVNVVWRHKLSVSPGDILATFVAGLFPALDMTALFAAAALTSD